MVSLMLPGESYDLYGLDHVTAWEPCDLHHLAHVPRVRSVLPTQIMHNISKRQKQDLLYL